MSKHKKSFQINESECFETDKFEMMDTDSMYSDRNTLSIKESGRKERRKRKEAEHRKRDRYLDETYGY